MERYFTVCHPFFKVKHTLRCLFSCFSFKPCFVKPLLPNKNEKHICFEATRRGSFALKHKFLIKLILPPCLEPPPPPQTYHLQNSISYFSTHIFFLDFFCLLFVILCPIQGNQARLAIVIFFWRTQQFQQFREQHQWKSPNTEKGCSKKCGGLC